TTSPTATPSAVPTPSTASAASTKANKNYTNLCIWRVTHLMQRFFFALSYKFYCHVKYSH
ncbi:hypothetical protein, partial [Bacteroides acidifaciens]|uniref:hypothetical protein n=1 Tax=Bacteroides acidifaciens TaxID=85831 RepID=UPI0025AE4C80